MEASRRLAAIMFTDIVGYTRLMGKDSDKALDLVRINKAIQKPLVKKHGGTWLKEMGDGAMAQFNSALDAVNCAIEIQKSAGSDLDAKLRIGIHLGDVVVSEKDVYGDGVNVASRLESIADPGGIYVSDSIEKAIRGQTSVQTKYLGELKLKNVDYGVRTYAILGEGIAFPSTKRLNKLARTGHSIRLVLYILVAALIVLGSLWLKDSPIIGNTKTIESLAVLPFDNLTGDSDQQFMLAGLHDNLITTLSQITSLRIISRTSTLQYQIKDKSTPDIARELGVDALLEASIIKFGDSVRINVQLVQAFPKEQHLWAEIFDWPLNNILNLYNQITQNIATKIDLSLTPREQTQLSNSRLVNPDAYGEYLKGQFHAEMFGLENALYHFQRSLQIDSSFAPAYAGIAFVWIVKWQFNQAAASEAVPKIYSFNQKALDLDEDYPESLYI